MFWGYYRDWQGLGFPKTRAIFWGPYSEEYNYIWVCIGVLLFVETAISCAWDSLEGV